MGERVGLEKLVNQGVKLRVRELGLRKQHLRRRLAVRARVLGQVGIVYDALANSPSRAGMDGDAIEVEKDLHQICAQLDPQLSTSVDVRSGVKVLVHMHGAVGMKIRVFPLTDVIGLKGEWPESGLFQAHKALFARDLEARVDLAVDPSDGFSKCVVDIAQAREDPAAVDEPEIAHQDAHRVLDQRFVFRLFGSGRHDRRSVVRDELHVVLVQIRIVAMRFDDAVFQAVGNDDRGHAAVKLKHASMGIEPVGFFLVFVSHREDLLAKAENADEDMRLMNLTGTTVTPVNLIARIVDLAVLTGPKFAERDGGREQAREPVLYVLKEVRVRRAALRDLFPDPLELMTVTDVALDRRPVDVQCPSRGKLLGGLLRAVEDVTGKLAGSDLGHKRAAAAKATADLPVRLPGLDQALNLGELCHGRPFEFHHALLVRSLDGTPGGGYDAIRKDLGTLRN